MRSQETITYPSGPTWTSFFVLAFLLLAMNIAFSVTSTKNTPINPVNSDPSHTVATPAPNESQPAEPQHPEVDKQLNVEIPQFMPLEEKDYVLNDAAVVIEILPDQSYRIKGYREFSCEFSLYTTAGTLTFLSFDGQLHAVPLIDSVVVQISEPDARGFRKVTFPPKKVNTVTRSAEGAEILQ